jgi:hypothetical protein
MKGSLELSFNRILNISHKPQTLQQDSKLQSTFRFQTNTWQMTYNQLHNLPGRENLQQPNHHMPSISKNVHQMRERFACIAMASIFFILASAPSLRDSAKPEMTAEPNSSIA